MVALLPGNLTDFLGCSLKMNICERFSKGYQKVCVVDWADFASFGVASAWSEL